MPGSGDACYASGSDDRSELRIRRKSKDAWVYKFLRCWHYFKIFGVRKTEAAAQAACVVWRTVGGAADFGQIPISSTRQLSGETWT
jgi:hypothetical protein